MDITRIERRIFLSELNAQMLEKGITQKELGKYLGIRQGQLSLWLSGNTGMSVDNLIRISNAVKGWETRNVLIEDFDLEFWGAEKVEEMEEEKPP